MDNHPVVSNTVLMKLMELGNVALRNNARKIIATFLKYVNLEIYDRNIKKYLAWHFLQVPPFRD